LILIYLYRYIEGLYSYPSPGAELNYHRIISEPI